MKRARNVKKRRILENNNTSISWLPFDSRLLPPIFAFGHVKGAARLFLEIEIVLSVFVVIGTCALAIWVMCF
jgi:hypothetical protein